MSGRNFLYFPGPTQILSRIRNAMNVEQENMCAIESPEQTKPLYAKKDIDYPTNWVVASLLRESIYLIRNKTGWHKVQRKFLSH